LSKCSNPCTVEFEHTLKPAPRGGSVNGAEAEKELSNVDVRDLRLRISAAAVAGAVMGWNRGTVEERANVAA
jgi:hypothetical protein